MHIINNPNSEHISPCVATIGFFDGVHRGHTHLIEEVKTIARQTGMKSMVITFPQHPKQVLQPERQDLFLLTTLEEKLRLLEKTNVDSCLLLPFTGELAQYSALAFMRLLYDVYQVRTLVVGHDHRFGHNRHEGFEQYRHYGKMLGMQVVSGTPLEEDGFQISSSLIRRLLGTGDTARANRYLGYTYPVSGVVVKGFRMGRTLGFPTANISPCDSCKLLPMGGVYAVYVWVDNTRYRGMLDIGTRPTMGNGDHYSVEVHILDFHRDIYGETITVEFAHYLREDIKYPSIEPLIEQLKQDEIDTRQLLTP